MAALKKSITIQIATLIAVLKKAKEVMESKPAQDILENVLIKVNGNKVEVIATDTMVALKGIIEGVNLAVLDGGNPTYATDFDFLLPAEFLQKYCSNIKTDSLTIDITDLKKSSFATLTAFNDVSKIDGLADVSKFPELPAFPDSNSIGISGEFISWMNAATHTCMAVGKHPTADKIYLGIKESVMCLVSTNLATLLEKKFDIQNTHTAGLMISTKIAKALSGFEETTISWSDQNIAFVSSDITLISRLYEGKYPNYRAVVPDHLEPNLNVLHADLKEAMTKVSLTNSSARVLLTKEKGMMIVESVDTEYGRTINSKIPCEYTGEVAEVLLNPKNVLDLLGQVKYVSLSLSVTDPAKAVVITTHADASYLSMVMPFTIPAKK